MFSQNRNKTTGLVAAGVLMMVVVMMMAHVESDAMPTLRGSLACARDYMVNLVRDKIISKTALVAEYQKSMDVVRQRFADAEKAGELEGKDDKERENFYLKLTVEEMRNLKDRVEAKNLASSGLDLDDPKINACKGKTPDDQYDPDAEVQGWSPDDEALEDDKEIEALLLTQLDELERQASGEDEMGWSLSPEVKESLKEQTRNVLVDLMNNEARQIAMAILTAYLSGGSSISAVLAPLLGGLKFKLAEFLVNAISDVVSAIMGRQITVTPGSVAAALVPTTPAPAA